jgi:hypothetical protein
MIARMIQPGSPVSPAQVWAGLTAECQARVIQSLARLASDLTELEPAPTPRRPSDGHTARRPEDPA